MASSSSIGSTSQASASAAQAFYTIFRSATSDLIDRISAAETSAQLKDVLQTYASLSAELTRAFASGILPAHDQGLHKRGLEEVATALEAKRKATGGEGEAGAGKKKGGFSFKRRAQPVPKPATPVTLISAELTDVVADPAKASLGTQKAEPISTADERASSHLTISALHNTSYNHTTSQSAESDCKTATSLDLNNISNSLVDLRSLSPSHTIMSVQLRTVTDSAVLLPAIEGSVMIHDFTGSLLTVESCHQFRMHTSKEVVVELSTKRGSVVTIEGCTAIHFVAKEGEGLKIQDFDDLINSEQLKGEGKRKGEGGNFSVVVSEGSNLANKVENMVKTGRSTKECVEQVIKDGHEMA